MPAPSLPNETVDLEPTDGGRPDVESDALYEIDDLDDIGYELDEAVGSKARHQLLGYARNIQHPIEEWAALVGGAALAGETERPQPPPGPPARVGPGDDWRLLLQIDSDDALGYSWGDFGRLYFAIQRSAIRDDDFTRTWFVAQH